MCLLSLAFHGHEDYPLVFAGNRDEMHARPTAAACWWDENTKVLGGRDLEAGGSWLGISRTGKFAVITNRPGVPAPTGTAQSRGNVVSEFLISEPDVKQFSAQLARRASAYAGFGLVCGSLQNLYYISQDVVPGELHSTSLPRGIFGISNTATERPWPKVTWLNEQLQKALQADAAGPDHLLELLGHQEPVSAAIAEDEVATLPFILHPQFGTRSSTVIIVNARGDCQFVERSFDARGRATGEIRLSFAIDLAG